MSLQKAMNEAWEQFVDAYTMDFDEFQYVENIDCFEAGFTAATKKIAEWIKTRDDFGSGSDEDHRWFLTMPKFLEEEVEKSDETQ